jgi:hypothetical protein
LVTLRVKVEELGNEKELLKETADMFQEETRRLGVMNSDLAGHNNHKQKIHLHAIIKDENYTLKHETLRLRNELKGQIIKLKIAQGAYGWEGDDLEDLAKAKKAKRTNRLRGKENAKAKHTKRLAAKKLRPTHGTAARPRVALKPRN